MPNDHRDNVGRFARIKMILKSLTSHTDELHRIAAEAREHGRRWMADQREIGRRRARMSR
jgi:hypothetical protein